MDLPVTAVDVDALDKLREALSEALGQLAMRGGYGIGVLASERLAADLLPVVDRIANERAAAARRAQQLWDRKRVEDYAAVIGVELTPGDDVIAAVDEVHRVGAAAELRAAADDLDAKSAETWKAYKTASPDDPRRANPYYDGAADAYETAATRVLRRADALDPK